MAETKTKDRLDGDAQWTDAEIAAMKEHAKEIKRAQQRKKGKDKGDGLRDLMEKIASLPESDRVMAEGIHATVMKAAPELEPRTYYGMPAWARDGRVLCWFTPAAKFKERYASFAFSADANLDEGTMWATSWALPELTKESELRIAELVKKAVS